MALGWNDDSFIYSNITGSLQTQFSKRRDIVKKLTARTQDDITYLNGNSSWVKVSSGVDQLIKDPETGDLEPSEDLAQTNVLFGGVYNDKDKKIKGGIFAKEKSGYTYSEQFGYRPMAGITTVHIKTQGTFGAIKKGTIEFSVNSLQEMEKFHDLYMLPGYSILIEWGHSVMLNNKGKLEFNVQTFNKWFTDLYNHKDTSEDHRSSLILKELDRLRYSQNFNYDALYGKVSNFMWSFNTDGTYTCTVDVTGYGELAESMSALFTTKPSDKEATLFKTNAINRYQMYLDAILDLFPSTSDDRPVSSFRKELNAEAKWQPGQQAMQTNLGLASPESVRSFLDLPLDSIGGTEAIKEYFTNYVILRIENSKADEGKATSTKFIPLGSLLNFLNDNFMLRDDGKKIIRFYSGQYNTEIKNESDRFFLYDSVEREKNTDTKYVNKTPFVTFDDHISSNIDVCFLPKGESDTRKYDVLFAKTKEVNESIIGHHNDILNILVNVQYINELYNELLSNNKNEDINVYDYVKNILNDITKSLGNINKFAIEEREQVLFISDRAGTPGRGDITYTLDLYGLKSLATNITLQSSIPSSLSTMIAIGASAGGTSTNEGIFNFQTYFNNFQDRIAPKRELDEAFQDSSASKTNISKEDREKLKKNANILAAFVRGINSKRTVIDQNFGDLISAHQTVTNLLLKKTLIDNNHNANGVIPIQLSFDIYGASGIRITDVFNLQEGILPSRYKDNVSFTVTAVDNNIEGNRWVTSVKALMMMTAPLKEIMLSEFDIEDIFEDIDDPLPLEIDNKDFPNATKVRNFIKVATGELFKEKGTELTSAGADITSTSAKLAIALMKNIYRQVQGEGVFDVLDRGPANATFGSTLGEANKPEQQLGPTTLSSLRFRWTGGNDNYHLYRPKDGNTLHRFGKALDLAIQPAYTDAQSALAKLIVAKASEEVMDKVKHNFKDEYTSPSSHANGPHFHFSVGGVTAQTELKARINKKEMIEARTTAQSKFDAGQTDIRAGGAK